MSQQTASTASLLDSGAAPHDSSSLTLGHLPYFLIIDAHMKEDERYTVVKDLYDHGAHITDNAKDAQIFIGKVSHSRRARLELRVKGLDTEPLPEEEPSETVKVIPRKRPRTASQGSDTASDSEDEKTAISVTNKPVLKQDEVVVVKTAWLYDCIASSSCLPLAKYTVYRATAQTGDKESTSASRANHTSQSSILERAAADNNGALTSQSRPSYVSTTQKQPRGATPSFVHQSTSEHDYSLTSDLLDPPEWVRLRVKYSCQRATPIRPPNDGFIKVLKTIREGRELTNDEIGVRAYSTSIAALAAYPHTLTSPREITALPGCSDKIAALFAEWKNNGATSRAVAAVRDLEDDARLNVLRLFHQIWGVGPAKARELYEQGWRDLDDVVEHGWNTLSRVQQLGVKYFDEFELKMSRSEIEQIEKIVAEHSRSVVKEAGFDPDDTRTCIVGGYRRGQEECGDADIMVSHLDTQATQDLVEKLVRALGKAEWITHKLIMQLGGSSHGQAPKEFQPNSHHSRNVFDGLDKALVVWQNPHYDGTRHDKNPNPHRRVDIIIAPWPRIGCAVLGWTGATTFERDIRRVAEKARGWRFDSSGIRDRHSGAVVEVETQGANCRTIEEAEKKVFSALGLEYLEPWERCTG